MSVTGLKGLLSLEGAKERGIGKVGLRLENWMDGAEVRCNGTEGKGGRERKG